MDQVVVAKPPQTQIFQINNCMRLHEIDVKRMMDIIDKSKQPAKPRPHFSIDYNRIPKSPRVDKENYRNTASQFDRWRQSAMLGHLGDMSHRTGDIARELWQVYTQIPQEGAEYTDTETWMLAGDWDKAVDIVSDAMSMSSDQEKRLRDSLAKYELTGPDFR